MSFLSSPPTQSQNVSADAGVTGSTTFMTRPVALRRRTRFRLLEDLQAAWAAKG